MDSIETLQTDETTLTPQEKEIVETLFQVSPQKNISLNYFPIIFASLISTFLASSLIKKIIFPDNQILYLTIMFGLFLILFSITKKM